MDVSSKRRGTFSVSPENISRVYLVPHIVQACIIAVGDDSLATALELLQVIDHPAAEERAAVLERRFVDDDFCALGLDALHHSLDAALAEVVAVRLHCQAVNSYGAALLFGRVVVPAVVVVVVAGLGKDTVRDEVLPRAVAVHYRLDQVLRNVRVVRQKLLRVLRKAVAPVAE